MQTRLKSGISKPKRAFTSTSPNYLDVEPPSFSIASALTPWVAAMKDEYSALHRQGIWTLVPPAPSQNIVGCKWVYKIKRHADGSVSRYKARLVAKGFHQKAGLDYDETFSPVIKPTTVRIILTLAAQFSWPLRQLDISNAFLHGFLKEDVYMAQPQGFIDSAKPGYVCKLHKSLYGLKQAPRAWFERFTSQLENLGFTDYSADPSLFTYKSHNKILYLLLYVDDIILIGTLPSLITNLITKLQQTFELKDFGPLHYFLGLQLQYHETHPRPKAHPYLNPTHFRSLVGALQYLTFTRLDLSFAVNQVCQFMHSPTDTHLVVAKRILRYLKGTLTHGLLFCPSSLTLQAYADANWAGNLDDHHSTSGYVVFLGSTPITWVLEETKHSFSLPLPKQNIGALLPPLQRSSGFEWSSKIWGFFSLDPPLLWCDNLFALALASNPMFHARTKHIEVDYHFIREKVVRRDVVVKFVSTTDQLADILTKCLPSLGFTRLRNNLLLPFRPP
uniref:Reverse transcriptase Ty1/copia-type domain-containing protein n=1 Tax=Fagus sylvatica TaxID=28930 RepID=A0A2N9I0T5_FAGSY